LLITRQNSATLIEKREVDLLQPWSDLGILVLWRYSLTDEVAGVFLFIFIYSPPWHHDNTEHLIIIVFIFSLKKCTQTLS